MLCLRRVHKNLFIFEWKRKIRKLIFTKIYQHTLQTAMMNYNSDVYNSKPHDANKNTFKLKSETLYILPLPCIECELKFFTSFYCVLLCSQDHDDALSVMQL